MKKTLKIVLMLCLVASMLFASVSSVFADSKSFDVTQFSELSQIFTDLRSGDQVIINLKNDIALESTLEIDVPCTINFYGPAKLSAEMIRAFYIYNDDVHMYFKDVTIYAISPGTNYGHNYHDDGQAFYINGSHCIIDGVRMEDCGNMTYSPLDHAIFDPIANAFTSWNGGAIYIDGWDNTITNCYFEACWAQDDGGAICIYYDDQLIQDCTFNNCKAYDDGGAIYCCVGVDDVVINRCTFTGCTCEDNTVGNNVYGRDNTLVAGCPQDQRTEALFYRCQFVDNYSGSFFSTGNIIIIAAVVVVVAAVIVFFVLKKKKTAAQN